MSRPSFFTVKGRAECGSRWTWRNFTPRRVSHGTYLSPCLTSEVLRPHWSCEDAAAYTPASTTRCAQTPPDYARLPLREGWPPRVRHAEGHLLPLARDTPRRTRRSPFSSLTFLSLSRSHFLYFPLSHVREIVTLAPRRRNVQGGACGKATRSQCRCNLPLSRVQRTLRRFVLWQKIYFPNMINLLFAISSLQCFQGALLLNY